MKCSCARELFWQGFIFVNYKYQDWHKSRCWNLHLCLHKVCCFSEHLLNLLIQSPNWITQTIKTGLNLVIVTGWGLVVNSYQLKAEFTHLVPLIADAAWIYFSHFSWLLYSINSQKGFIYLIQLSFFVSECGDLQIFLCVHIGSQTVVQTPVVMQSL